jgi:hypothetical protein
MRMAKNRLSGEKHPLNLFFANSLKSVRFVPPSFQRKTIVNSNVPLIDALRVGVVSLFLSV